MHWKFMSSTRRILKFFAFFCLLDWMWKAAGSDFGVFNITRLKDGDLFTKSTTKGNHSKCRSSFAVHVASLSQSCSVTCKCQTSNATFSTMLDKCVSDYEILQLYNCSGPFLPRGNKPLYNLAKSGKARFNTTYSNNATDYCQLTEAEYFNGTEFIKLSEVERKMFDVLPIENGSIRITWHTTNISYALGGSILALHILCQNMTSPGRCILIKTAGTKSILREKQNPNLCTDDIKTSTDDMLVYILVGVSSGFVLIALLVVLFACFHRRSKRSRSTSGSRRPFKPRSSNKGNEPTTPAIHDLIFNGLTWEGDGGFSNRAIADPRLFEVDYGIPVDFSDSLTRPNASCESNRNSLSPLTEIGDSTGR